MTTNEEELKKCIDYLDRHPDCDCDICRELKIRTQVQREIDELKIKLAFKNEKINDLDKELSNLKKELEISVFRH